MKRVQGALLAVAMVMVGAWCARAEVLAMSEDELLASYPHEVAKRLGLAPTWVPALCPGQASASAMPSFQELTEGLDAMMA